MTDVDPWVESGGARPASEAAGARRVVIGILLWGAAAFLALWSVAPPSSVPAGAGADEASGGRALEVLERLARGGVDAGQASPPRPIGSAANDRCRERILDELRRIGLQPEVHEAFGASARFSCAGTVRNVVCRLRGVDSFASSGASSDRSGEAILCMAHLDSVGAGPGVGDDLAGVAAWIEVARALIQGGPLGRDVIFLFEDGEEHGLLGAEVFAASHPWASDIGAVVNLEGRGTTGPSRLFETGPGNEWIVRAFADEASAPSSTSVSSEIYKRMPNDTDYTVWRDRGVPGLNFAFIGGVSRYHTALDDLAHLSEDSLQHHVTNGFQAVKALAASPDLRRAGTGGEDAVFFDVLRRRLVIYSVRTARALGILLFFGALLVAARSIRRGFARPLAIAGALPLIGLVCWVGYQGAVAEEWVYSAVGVLTGVAQPAHFEPTLVGLLAGAAAGMGLAVFLTAYLVRASEVGAAATLLLAGLSAATAWEAPGVSFVFTVPAAVLVIGGGLMRLRGDVEARWARVGVVALAFSALLVLTPIHQGLLGAFGVRQPGVAALPLLLGGALLLPAMVTAGRSAGLWLAGVGLITAVIAAAFLATLDTHTPVEPGHLNLVHVQGTLDGAEGEDATEAIWQLQSGRDAVDPDVLAELAEALGAHTDEDLSPGYRLPWSGKAVASVPAPVVSEERPSLTVLSETSIGEGRTLVRARALPGRPSDQLIVRVDGSGALIVDGVSMPEGKVRFLGPRETGEEFTFVRSKALEELAETERTIELWSQQFGLRGVRGRSAESYLGARPADLVPYAHGDGSLIRTTIKVSETQGDAR